MVNPVKPVKYGWWPQIWK